jgi:AraC-like DNA-binding protein
VELTDYDPGISILMCDCFRVRNWNLANLSAPFWRFYWNRSAGAAARLAGREVRLLPGKCLVIPPDTPFSAHMRRPVVHFYMHFLANPPFDRAKPGIYTFPAAPLLRRAIEEIVAMLNAGGRPLPRLALLERFLATHALSRVPADRLYSGNPDPRVRSAAERMERDLAAPLSNDDLAEDAGMSTNAFIRLFRHSTGSSPQAWRAVRRVERACILLGSTAESIERIAALTGFCDRYHFSRAFKRLRGLGPAEYRRRARLETASHLADG